MRGVAAVLRWVPMQLWSLWACGRAAELEHDVFVHSAKAALHLLCTLSCCCP